MRIILDLGTCVDSESLLGNMKLSGWETYVNNLRKLKYITQLIQYVIKRLDIDTDRGDSSFM